MKKKIDIKIVLLVVLIVIVGSVELVRYRSSVEAKKSISTYVGIRIRDNGGRGFIEADGNVEANDTKKVFVDKKLKVDEVFIQEGDYVEKGQLLMTFDETERNNTMRKLERERLALSKLKRDILVEKELYKIGGSSANSVKDMQEEIRKSEINIEEYMEDLAKTAEKIESPVSGTITSLTAQENYLVDTDSPLMEIADLSDIKIVLEVPEYDVKDIELGQKLMIKPEVFEKKVSYPGVVTKISRISKVSETTSENVLEVEVKPDEAIPHIVPGFKVSAVIYLEQRSSGILIPKTAILEDEGKYIVFVSDDGVLSKRVVELENIKGDEIAVKSGLKVGETILTAPDETLKDGSRVFVEYRGNEKKGAKENDKGGAPK